MRIALALALLAFLFSLPYAWGRFQSRVDAPATASFVVDDPVERARLGASERWIGVALSGWAEAAAAPDAPPEYVAEHIATGLHLSAAAVAQPGLIEVVAPLTDTYVEQRGKLDPDGALLQRILDDWVETRLRYPDETIRGFYAKIAAALFLAARDDARGYAMLRTLMGRGEVWYHLYPYVRRFYPRWIAIENVTRTYLAKGARAARVEAGMTLLDYHVRFGVGGDLLEKHLAQIRADFKEVKAEVRAGRLDPDTIASAKVAFLGMAMLANLGYEEEKTILARLQMRYYPHHVEFIRIARIWAGLDPFSTFSTRSERFTAFDPPVRRAFYDAAAHRLAAIRRLPPAEQRAREEERERCLSILTDGFEGREMYVRIMSMGALARADETLGRDALRRAVAERTILSIHAGILAQREDLVPILVPAMRSAEVDTSALAAVALLDLDGPLPLQE